MQISNSPNVNFQAKKIALTKNVFNGVSTHIDLYELTSRDIKFLEKLKDQVNISELMPNLSQNHAKSWQDVLDFTINASMDKSVKKYLAVSAQKPCGIMAVQKEGRMMNLLGISSIPTDVNQKVNYSGSTLFCHLFKMAKDSKSKSLVLEAVKNSAFDLVSKYRKRGFHIGEQGERYITMKCPKKNVINQLKQLQATTGYTSTRSKKDILLDSII